MSNRVTIEFLCKWNDAFICTKPYKCDECEQYEYITSNCLKLDKETENPTNTENNKTNSGAF